MAASLKIGDVVQLKSGGPKMTITRPVTDTNEMVAATWFAGAKKEAGVFYPETLVLVPDAQPK